MIYRKSLPISSKKAICFKLFVLLLAFGFLMFLWIYLELYWLIVFLNLICFTMIFLVDVWNGYWLAKVSQYSVESDGVDYLIFGKKYKKVLYSECTTIIISNGAFTNRGSRGKTVSIPMKNNEKNCPYPYITMHDLPHRRIELKPKEFSVDIYCWLDVQYIGICWFDALKKLLEYSSADVYILEDVYLNYKEEFDNVLTLKEYEQSIQIATNDGNVDYYLYLDNVS